MAEMEVEAVAGTVESASNLGFHSCLLFCSKRGGRGRSALASCRLFHPLLAHSCLIVTSKQVLDGGLINVVLFIAPTL